MKKITRLTIAFACFIAPQLHVLADDINDDDDFCLWTEIGVKKNLPMGWSVGVETEIRTEDNTSRMRRLSAGVNVGYRLGKHVKFGASYNYLGIRYAAEYKDHFKTRNDGTLKLDEDGNPIWNGYKTTPAYWASRHRANFEVTGTVKLWRTIRFSLRERYQYTHKCEREVDETKYRFDIEKQMDAETGEIAEVKELKDGYPLTEKDIKEAENDHILRSRLKVELDKKGVKWSPYISVECHNNLNAVHEEDKNTPVFYLKKVRAGVGVGYKFNKQHSVSAGYVITRAFDEDYHKRIHAISLGYEFEF
ncbi:MAG: DUF2490 domain-containing protein [Bacteroidales bacterium]|nr:DUF2490 domain-containing protein [Candidatus Physcousia equi]